MIDMGNNGNISKLHRAHPRGKIKHFNTVLNNMLRGNYTWA
jgi:hypothetical protein